MRVDTDLRRWIKTLPKLDPPITSAHSPMGPSSAARLMLCPGSYKESLRVGRTRPVVPETISAAAQFGTDEHTLTETHLRAGTMPEIRRELALGTKVPGEAARWHIHTIASDLAKADKVAWILVEEMLDGRRLHPLLFGTVDCAMLWRDRKKRWRLSIYDLKSGIYAVPPSALQLQLYAGLCLIDPRIRDLLLNVWQIETIVVQPYNDMYGDDAVARAPHTVLSILKAVAQYTAVMKEATDRDAAMPPLMSGKHCIFCPARIACETLATARAEIAIRSLPSDIDDLFGDSFLA